LSLISSEKEPSKREKDRKKEEKKRKKEKKGEKKIEERNEREGKEDDQEKSGGTHSYLSFFFGMLTYNTLPHRENNFSILSCEELSVRGSYS
jgi:hypothetical protein